MTSIQNSTSLTHFGILPKPAKRSNMPWTNLQTGFMLKPHSIKKICLQNFALRQLTNHDKFIIVEADKNMGVTVFNREDYIKQVLEEHLNNKQVYLNITKEYQSRSHDLQQLFTDFCQRHKTSIGKSAHTFLLRSQEIHGNNIARFRATAKVHKHPLQLRPIVAKVGTAIESLSKWLDVMLQKLMKQLPWCIKDSATFRSEVIKIEVPHNAKLVTFDAISMYSNIDLDHANAIMQHWLETYVPEHPNDALPKNTILEALDLVMRHNIMQFGDSYFLQLVGTAMGTSVAVVFANLYFGWHEKTTLLPKYRDNLKRILFHSRFVDDVFFIWSGDTDQEWEELCHDYNNFGILIWEFTKPRSSVDFLDLTLTKENGRIVTTTYQKPNNPYLYIPPHSAHPPGMINGIIYSLLRTYYTQNSKYSDFVHFTNLLFKRHVTQGWDQVVLKQVFEKALAKLKTTLATIPPTCDPSPRNSQERLFFHIQYHPNNIPRKNIRKLYVEECEKILRDKLDVNQLTIAYSRPNTIGNIVAKAKLYQETGKEVSKYITGEIG